MIRQIRNYLLKLQKKGVWEKIRKQIPDEIVNDFYHFPKSVLALLRYFWPAKNLIVIGVTGTDGKTTTANLIYHVLKNAGYPVSLISTVRAVVAGREYDTGLHVTNPGPFELQRMIRSAVDAGSKYLVLEVTSHGLMQYRNLGIGFYISLITNVSHEHLDYHKTMHNYILAKVKILRGAKYSVLNKDNKYFRTLKNHYSGRLLTFSLKKPADFNLKNFPFKTKLIGKFNKSNCLAAIAACKTIGVGDEEVRKAIFSFTGVPGRMEEVKARKNFRIFIDFAHKPNALKNVLESVRIFMKNKGRLIAVFGCAGLRDRTKRAMMGEISARLSDITVITAEDPRTENVNKICSQIGFGAEKGGAFEIRPGTKKSLNFKNKHYFVKIPDRKKAISWAIKTAKKNDLVIFCGKGHEKSMCFGRTEYPWNEKEEILAALTKIHA